MRKSVSSLFFILALTVSWAQAHGIEDPAWLLGKWELTEAPDGNKVDFYAFYKGGKVSNKHMDGSEIRGKFHVDDEDIKMVFEYKGKPVHLVFVPSEDKNALYFRSARTGNTSVYTRLVD